MITVLALFFACNSMHLPEDAVAPRPGSLEKEVATLPALGVPIDLLTHWSDPEKLLVRMQAPNGGNALVVVDGKTATTYCNSVEGYYGGPYTVGWTNDVGQWDVIDGRLYLRSDVDTIVSCGTDGLPYLVPEVITAHTSWPAVSAMTNDGYISWRQDSPTPSHFAWVGSVETPIPYDGPAPFAVTKRRDARGDWFVTVDNTLITLWNLDADTLAITQLYTQDLGAVPAAVLNIQPDALVIQTDQGVVKAASGTLGDGFHVVDTSALSLSASDEFFAWSDGRGFSVWNRGGSVNLAEDRTLVLGNVTYQGQHIVLEGPPEATVVNVYDNAGDPSDPITTWDADLSTHFDWLDGVASEALYEGFGFANGICGVARWGAWWGMDANTVPTDEGDPGWGTADSVVYLGPCDKPMEVATRELWTEFSVSRSALKLDIPVFQVTTGQQTENGFYDADDPYDGFDIVYDAWGMNSKGSIVPLVQDVDFWMPQRQGTSAWSVKDLTVYHVDAERQLK